jgi:hypothetical protein
MNSESHLWPSCKRRIGKHHLSTLVEVGEGWWGLRDVVWSGDGGAYVREL